MNRKMKTLRTLMLFAVVALAAATFQSCDLDDDDDAHWSSSIQLATATIKPSENSWYMQLNDSVVLSPSNAAAFKLPEKETRAYIRYTLNREQPTVEDVRNYSINLLSVDTFLTKKMAPLAIEPEKVYGNDPVEIVNSWETVAEDGYLNIRFRTRFTSGKTHRVNLVHRTDANTPYLVDFFHDANGDTNGVVADDVVAFKLDEAFNYADRPIEITLRWNSYSGEKTATFKYIPRKE